MEQDDAHHVAKMASANSDDVQPDSDMAAVEGAADEADMTRWTEAEFEEKCTYIVKDTTWEAGPEGDVHAPKTASIRAQASLPRNLMFKHTADGKEVRHQHTHTISSLSECNVALAKIKQR